MRVAQKGADRPADRVDGHRLDRLRDEDLEQHRESGQGRLPQGLRPPYPAAFRGLTSARVAYRPRVQKESPLRLFFQGAVCIFGHRQFPPPDDQATLQNCGCRGPKPAAELPKPVDSTFDGLVRLWSVSIKFVLAQLCFWVGIGDGGSNDVRGYCKDHETRLKDRIINDK